MLGEEVSSSPPASVGVRSQVGTGFSLSQHPVSLLESAPLVRSCGGGRTESGPLALVYQLACSRWENALSISCFLGKPAAKNP